MATRRPAIPMAAMALALAASSCGYSKAVLAAPPKGFVERRPETADGIVTPITPFQYCWADPAFHAARELLRDRGWYTLYVAEVGTGLLALEQEDDEFVERAA